LYPDIDNNCRWDEWVSESRLLKLNEENVQRQRALALAHKPPPVKKSTSEKSSTKKRETNVAAAGGAQSEVRLHTFVYHMFQIGH
jgi:mortality factor 4-like protein 1